MPIHRDKRRIEDKGSQGLEGEGKGKLLFNGRGIFPGMMKRF
jgi:hypothetical protein